MSTRESEAIDKVVRQYLIDLGYGESDIHYDVQTGQGRRADVVVYADGEPQIVAEYVPPNKGFPSDKDEKRLRFDPYVRQLQSYAVDLNAAYFLLTDGRSFLWFTTDRSGRPLLLGSPVRATRASRPGSTPARATREDIRQTLHNLRAFVFKRAGASADNDAAVFMLAKVLSDRGDNGLKQSLFNDREMITKLTPTRVRGLRLDKYQEDYYLEHAFQILSAVDLSASLPADVLASLDEVFIDARALYGLRTPRWVMDLMVHLSGVKEDSVVVDVNCGYGDVLAAVALRMSRPEPNSLWGVSRDPSMSLWAKVQLALFNQSVDSVLTEDLLYTGALPQQVRPPTDVISVLPFGPGKISNAHPSYSLSAHGVGRVDDLLIELSLRTVPPRGTVTLLVPENILFAPASRRIREFIVNTGRILAVVSLAAGALKPYSNVKTSILVLESGTSEADYEMFMAHVDEFPSKVATDNTSAPQVGALVASFLSWKVGKATTAGSGTWSLPLRAIDLDHLPATFYNPDLHVDPARELLQHSLAPLAQVSQLVKRGSSVKLHEDGILPVIGPASIRPVGLDSSKFGKTIRENLPARPLVAQPGDVVINNISMYLGAAAVVDETSAGAYVSQHVILVRPDPSVILPQYLAAALNSDYVKPQILQRSTGAIMPSIPVRLMADVLIPLPDLETQRLIAESIGHARDELTQAEQQLRRAEHLFSSLVQHLSLPGEDDQ